MTLGLPAIAPRVIGAVHALRSDALTRSSLPLMITTIGNSLIGYVFWVICARSFSASQVGTFSALISAATIAATMSDLGLRTMLMQHLPRERERDAWSRRVSGALLLAILSSAVFGVAAVELTPLLSSEIAAYLDLLVAVLVVLLTIFTTVFTMLDGISMSESRSSQILLRGTAYGVGKVVVVAALLMTSLRSPVLILLATVAGVGIATTWGVLSHISAARPDWRFTTRRSLAGLRDVRTALAGHYLINLGGWLPMFVLPLEVVARLSTQQNAYMTLTWMVGYAFFTVSPSVSSALFVQGRWNPDGLRSATRRAAKLIAALLIPAGLFMALFGRWILGLFGSGYAHYGFALLMVLLASAVPDAITNLRLGRLRAVGRLASGARLNLGMAVLAIVLTWILLPPLGIVGVGIAWLTAQSAGSVWGVIEDRVAGPLIADAAHLKGDGAAADTGGIPGGQGQT